MKYELVECFDKMIFDLLRNGFSIDVLMNLLARVFVVFCTHEYPQTLIKSILYNKKTDETKDSILEKTLFDEVKIDGEGDLCVAELMQKIFFFFAP